MEYKFGEFWNKQRQRIEKYITGIVNNNDSKMYSIYAYPEHMHFIV
jgi:putative transposase